MGKIRKILETRQGNDRIKALGRLCLNRRGGPLDELVVDHQDISYILEEVDSIQEPGLWQALWQVLLQAGANDQISRYCETALRRYIDNSAARRSSLRLDFLMRYLFKNAPGERETLMRQFLHTDDVKMRMAAAEELARSDHAAALREMLDIYESAFYTNEHEVVNGIELWITQEGTPELFRELRERGATRNDEALKQRFKWLMRATGVE